MSQFINKVIIFSAFILIITHSIVFEQSQKTNQGNFTAGELTIIQNIIGAAQDMYGPSNFTGIAGLVSDMMGKAFKKCWNVYVYDSNTETGTFSAHILNEKWIKWFKYGRLGLTYFIIFDSSTFPASGLFKVSQDNPSFGKDITNNQKDYITNLINETVIFKGDNMQTSAQHIKSKLYPGNWNVFIAGNTTNDFGGFECRRTQNWGRFQHFSRFKWNFYVVRTY